MMDLSGLSIDETQLKELMVSPFSRPEDDGSEWVVHRRNTAQGTDGKSIFPTWR